MNIIESSNYIDIISELKTIAPNGAHFTNGIYALEASIIVPSMLAGFKRVADAQSAPLPLVIAA